MTAKKFKTLVWSLLGVVLVILLWALRSDLDSAYQQSTSGSNLDEKSFGSAETLNSGLSSLGPSSQVKKRESVSRLLNSDEIKALGKRFSETLDASERRRVFEQLITGMTAANVNEVREQLEGLRPDSSEFNEFHSHWGKVSRKEALLAAAGYQVWPHGDGAAKKAVEAVMAGWASVDPEGARQFFNGLEWNSSNPKGNRNYLSPKNLMMGLVHGLAVADPDTGADFVYEQFGEGKVDSRTAGHMIRNVANVMANQQGIEQAKLWVSKVPDVLRSEAEAGVARKYVLNDVGDTLNWLESLDGRQYHGAAYYHTFHAWMGEDPATASEYISKMPESYQRDEAIKALAHQTIHKDSELAIEWAENIAEPSFRHRSFRDTFQIWTNGDAVSASARLARMESSPERDYAIQGFANSMSEKDPATAIVWADAIGDIVMREASLVTVGKKFFESDPDAAKVWLPESGLTEEAQERVVAGSE